MKWRGLWFVPFLYIKMNTIVLLLGGNLDDSITILTKAEELLNISLGKKLKESSFYKSEPWGFNHHNWFINKALLYATNLSAQETLEHCLQIEQNLGRIRNQHTSYQARTIDIDILFFNNEIIASPTLTVPHPRIQDRRFALIPLVEIYPELVHPVLQKSMKTLLELCNDSSVCQRL